MPRLSIVIACANDTELFETTLASVLQHRPADCEVIVVHPYSYSDPYELSDEVDFVDAGPGAKSSVRLVNAGVLASSGAVVHVLDVGLEVEEGWADRALSRFDDERVSAVAPLILDQEDPQRIACAGVNYGAWARRTVAGKGRPASRGTRNEHVLGPSGAAGFYRGDVLRGLGGFDPSVGDEMADVDMALTLMQLGLACVSEPSCQLRGIGASQERRQPSFNAGRQREQMFWRHWKTQGGVASLMLHPVAVAFEALANVRFGNGLGHLLGRVQGCFDFGARGRYERRLKRNRRAAEASPPAEQSLSSISAEDGVAPFRNQAA